MDFLLNNNNKTLVNNNTKLLRWSFKLRNAQLWTQTTYSTTPPPRPVTTYHFNLRFQQNISAVS